MGNFLQDVGRSTISSSIKDLITSKLAIDQGERADVASANASALSAEQLIQAKRANAVAEAEQKRLDEPISLNSIDHLVYGGREGPVFKHLYGAARAEGLIDEKDPNNPSMSRRNFKEVEKIFVRDSDKIVSMSIGMATQKKRAIEAELLKKPSDPKLMEALDAASAEINQFTGYGKQLEIEKLKKIAATERTATLLEEGRNARAEAAEEGRNKRAELNQGNKQDSKGWKTWIDPTTVNLSPDKQRTVTIRANEEPPPSYVPYSAAQANKEEQKPYRTWVTQDTASLPPEKQKVLTLKSNVEPPEGYIPFSQPATPQLVGTNPETNAPIFAPGKGSTQLVEGKMPEGQGGAGSAGIGPKSLARLPAQQQDTLNKYRNVQDIIPTVRAKLDKDIKSSLGMISGPLRSLKSLAVDDPKWVDFKATNAELFTFIYALSGMQTNEAEKKTLDENILPNLKNPGKNYEATLNVLEKWLDRNYKNNVQAFKKAGYIVGDIRESVPSHGVQQAPQAAIDFLRANPSAAQDFKAKFGYLPEGF